MLPYFLPDPPELEPLSSPESPESAPESAPEEDCGGQHGGTETVGQVLLLNEDNVYLHLIRHFQIHKGPPTYLGFFGGQVDNDANELGS